MPAALLALQVSEEGGAEQVIKSKRWRDVGDAFKLPKTITSVSFVLRRGYMQYLWDYEQARPPPWCTRLCVTKLCSLYARYGLVCCTPVDAVSCLAKHVTQR